VAAPPLAPPQGGEKEDSDFRKAVISPPTLFFSASKRCMIEIQSNPTNNATTFIGVISYIGTSVLFIAWSHSKRVQRVLRLIFF
jgi:hypothetical protein